jgi:type I restriction enzyme S subunit
VREGWQTRKLGELCRIRTGKKDVNEGNPAGTFPFFTCAASHTYSDTYSFDTEALLIAGNGDVGRVSYYKGKFEAYQRTYVISDFVGVLPRFLYLILDGNLRGTVSKQKLGNTMPYIKLEMLTGYPVPVPPLSEQRRVVQILDEAYGNIATARADAEKNLQDSRAVFESYLAAVLTRLREQHDVRSLASLVGSGAVQLGRGKVISKRDMAAFPGHFPVYSSAKENDGKFGEYGLYMFDEELITWSVDGGGRLFHRPRHKFSVTNVGGILRIHNQDVLSYEYLFRVLAYLHSQIRFDWVRKAHPSVILKLYNDIPLPPLDVQKEVIESLGNLESETQRLESIYQRKLAALDALKQSLLHQAFTGQLGSEAA